MNDKKGHYKKCLENCLQSLKRQTIVNEVIISEHRQKEYINKGYLLNRGIEKSRFDTIWFCDADFTLEDKFSLQKMFESKEYETQFPVFLSKQTKKLKPADGGGFIKKETLKRFGKFDEADIGISYVTFPFLKWCIDNTRFKIRKDIIIVHENYHNPKKKHRKTAAKLKSVYYETINKNEYQMSDM